MNTLLLPTNTANCTTKNLKMMAAVIFMTAVFVFTNLVSFAQEETPVVIPLNGKIMTIEEAKKEQAKQEAKPSTQQEVKVAEKKQVNTVPAPKAGVYSPAEKTAPTSKLPYYNYKGITNLDEAKKAWIADHPEEYKSMNGNNTPAAQKQNVQQNNAKGSSLSSPGVQQGATNTKTVVAVKPANGQSPNADRRLPANYDDSKTNVKSKE